MKVLFATENESKIKRFKNKLLEKGIELISINDLENKVEVEENGVSALEYAMIKARAYKDIVDMPVFAMDDSLYIENIPENKQPGLYVRRINGTRLSDEEMIEYYSKLAEEYGDDGKLTCRWVYGIALINDYMDYTYTWSKDDFYLTNVPNEKRNPGYPLNSISINKKLNKYFVDMTEEDKNDLEEDESDVIDFLCKRLLEK